MEENLVEILHEYRSLLSSPGWVRLVELAKEQEQVRANQILMMDLSNVESVLEMQKLKSERVGIKLFRLIPETIIERLEEELDDNVQDEASSDE